MRSQELVRGLLSAVLGNAASVLSSLAVVMVGARNLSKEEMGEFFLVTIIATFAITASEFGLRSAVIRSASEESRSQNPLAVNFLITVSAIASAIASFALYGMGILASSGIFTGYQFLTFAWACGTSFALANWLMGQAALAGLRLFAVSFWSTILAELLRVAISVILLSSGFGVGSLYWGVIASRFAGVAFILLRVPALRKFTLNCARPREVLSFGGWIYGSSLASVVTARIADLTLNSALGPSALAVYSTAMQIPILITRAYEAIRPVILTYAAAQGAGMTGVLVNGTRLVVGILSLVGIIVILVVGDLIPLVFSPRYQECVPVATVLVVWTVVGLTNYFVSTVLMGGGRGKEVFLFAILQLPVMLLLCVTAIPRYGAMGAALAMVLTSGFGSITYGFLLRRTSEIKSNVMLRSLAGGFAILMSYSLYVASFSPNAWMRLFGAVLSMAIIFCTGIARLSDIVDVVSRIPAMRRPGARTH